MTDTVTISRECAEWALKCVRAAFGVRTPGYETELDSAISSPPPPSDTMTISRECAWLIYFDDRDMPPEIFTGCGAEDAAHKRFKMVSGNWNCTLFQSVSPSPPPPSGLREALEEIKQICESPGDLSLCWADKVEQRRKKTLDVAIAALASPSEPAPAKAGDGWVKVDESNPLPKDLQVGDELAFKIELLNSEQQHGSRYWLYRIAHKYRPYADDVTSYRRRPSAEQGG